jgi:hypothetical protein
MATTSEVGIPLYCEGCNSRNENEIAVYLVKYIDAETKRAFDDEEVCYCIKCAKKDHSYPDTTVVLEALK